MEEEIEYSIKKIVDYLDKDSDDFKLKHSKNGMPQYGLETEHLISLIVESDLIKKEELRISNRKIREEIKNILNDIKKSDGEDIIEKFEDKKDKLHRRLGKKDYDDYTIVFPLNFNFKSSEMDVDEYAIKEEKIIKLEYDEWEENYKSKAYDTEEESQVEFAISMSPNDFSEWFTYWKFNYAANDYRYGIEKLKNKLELLLGKISFSLHVQEIRLYESEKLPLRSNLTEIRMPFIFLIFKDSEYDHYELSNDPSKRKRVDIKGTKEKRYKGKFPQLPNFDKTENDLNDRLAKAFRLYQKAMENPSREEGFLTFWRGFELLTLTTREDNMYNVCERLRSTIEYKDEDEVIKTILDRLRKKRNTLVHKGYECQITLPDLSESKTIFENIIKFYLMYRDEYDKDDLEYILKNYHKGKQSLRDKKKYFKWDIEDKKRKIELIDEMLEWD
ncbi:MAG: hypothetical protein ACOC5T_01310 [Elusimicrobiota bacterium]